VGAQSVGDFCSQIETYLCKKNDGHLIRVTGPSFELVSSWAAQGIPLKVAYAGIDRYFERYYRKGPRRRPVKIDFWAWRTRRRPRRPMRGPKVIERREGRRCRRISSVSS
jgi:hypothetical protein